MLNVVIVLNIRFLLQVEEAAILCLVEAGRRCYQKVDVSDVPHAQNQILVGTVVRKKDVVAGLLFKKMEHALNVLIIQL